MKRPHFLYRYLSLSGERREWVRQAIVDGRHYFANPRLFNDPFDCWPTLLVNGTDADLKNYYEHSLAADPRWVNHEARQAELVRLLSDPASDMRQPERAKLFRQEFRQEIEEITGVMCFSEVRDDLLMWAHYADSHRGLCLMFDGTADAFRFAERLRYRQKRPRMRVFGEVKDASTLAFATKSTHWRYEKEWRLIEFQSGLRDCPQLRSALVGVVLGAKATMEDRDLVRSWANALSPAPRIYQASTSESNYRLRLR